MNHKRGRAKNRRAGCILCKPHKANGAKGDDTSKGGRRVSVQEIKAQLE